MNKCTVFDDYHNDGVEYARKEMRREMLDYKVNLVMRLIREEFFSVERTCDLANISVSEFLYEKSVSVGEERVAKLARCLIRDNRTDDLSKLVDEEARNRLFKEYDID